MPLIADYVVPDVCSCGRAAGVFDYIKRVNEGSTLVGFLMGPHGVYTGAYTIIDDVLMARYRNMGVRASFTNPFCLVIFNSRPHRVQ